MKNKKVLIHLYKKNDSFRILKKVEKIKREVKSNTVLLRNFN